MSIGDQLAERDDKTAKTISPHQKLQEAVRIMMSHNVGSLVVIEEDERPVGIITERDIIKAIHEDGREAPMASVNKYMNSDVAYCSPEATTEEILEIMSAYGIRHLPIISGDKILGLVGIRDVLECQRAMFWL